MDVTTASVPTALDDVGGRWVDRTAQAGLVARGVVYLLVGAIALQLAVGQRGSAEDSRGAIEELSHRSFGGILVGLVAAGLAAYALSCALGAVRGRGGKKGGPSDTGDRLRDAWRAVINGLLAAFAVSVLLQRSGSGSAGGGSGNKEQTLTARVLGWPAGPLLVGAIGVALAGFGAYQVVKAFKRSFTKGLDLQEASPHTRSLVERFGTIGYTARGAVYGIVGWFLVKAAVQHDPNDAVGLDGALARLARASYGPLLLAAVAVGLVCFGLWSMVEARYRRMSG